MSFFDIQGRDAFSATSGSAASGSIGNTIVYGPSASAQGIFDGTTNVMQQVVIGVLVLVLAGYVVKRVKL